MSYIMEITKKYLTFDVNYRSTEKKVLIKENDELILDLDIRLDNISPNFKAYVNVERFIGKKISISCEQDMPFEAGEADEIGYDGLYCEPMRPTAHFTVKNGYNNDPNGLFYYNGAYHMFFQYNPCGRMWGNMHWGHAVSYDLIHWRELDELLCPDEYGTAYSGSAYIDEKNASGLKKGDNAPILLFYTAAGGMNRLSAGKPFTQRLAYSTDGGVTFVKYPETVLEHIAAYNRDPMVSYCDELGKYLMVIYLESSDFGFFVSDDLLHWNELQRFTVPDENECPCFRKVKVRGTDEAKWVFIGCHNSYSVADVVDGKFVFTEGTKRLNNATSGYAAQCFAGMENGDTLQTEWIRTDIPENNIRMEMSIPYLLYLEKTEKGYMLFRQPDISVEQLALNKRQYESFDLSEPLKIDIERPAVDISLDLKYDKDNCVDICIFGQHIILNMKKNTINVQKNSSTLSDGQKTVEVRIIVDKCSVEVFADGGRYSFSAVPVMDYNLKYMKITADKPIEESKLTVKELDDIWKEQKSV